MYRELIKDIWAYGGEAYLVGGWVRDKLLGVPEKEIKDTDLEILGISREKFEDILGKYGKFKRVGKTYEIYILNNDIEISFIDREIQLKECAKRRDLTINSVYYDPLKMEYMDFFDGIRDIGNKILKHVSVETFMEDPLRILRVAQFMSRFGFSVDPSLEKIIMERGEEILKVPRERVCHELEKIYFLGGKPSEGFDFLEKTGILEKIIPELTDLKDVFQDEIYHPEGDVYTHTMMMLDVLPREERTAEIFWGIIYHDSGKKETYPSFEGHCEKSKEIFEREIVKFTGDRNIVETVKNLIEYHEEPLKMLISGGPDRISVKKLASKVDINKLLKLYKCDVLGRGRNDNTQELELIDRVTEIYNEVKPELKPIVRGRDLINWGIEPKKDYGKILEKLYEAQLEEKFENIGEAREFFFGHLSGGRIYKGI